MEGRYIATYRTLSHWGSCRTITTLINQKYDGFTEVCLDENEIPKNEINYLAITDHRWLTSDILKLLKTVTNAQIDWYIFGDFTIKLCLFKTHLEALSHLSLNIYVASSAHKELVLSLFPEVKDLLKVRPYPIDKNLFVPSEEGRNSWRQKLSITNNNEKLFGYIGRISPQKGIIQLMQTFLKNENSLPGKLILAGPIDPHPFWQFSDVADETFIPMLKKLLFLGESKIEWIPWVEPADLPGLYSALDLFVSPSYFHDEDFGLTLTEARSCGVKCLVTEWGGYKRLSGDPDVRFVGLEETEMGYKVHMPSLAKALISFESVRISQSASAQLSAEERKRVINTPNFLSNNGRFDLEIYKKLYGVYV